MVQHSEAPWRFEAVPHRAGHGIEGHILPHGAGEDDPCVAYVEGVGSTDLALMLAAPDLLAALEGLIAEIGAEWPDEWRALAYEEAVAAIRKAEGD